jgi:hypothetical protein
MNPSFIHGDKVTIEDDQFVPKSIPDLEACKQEPRVKEFKGQRVIDARFRHPRPEPLEARHSPEAEGESRKSKTERSPGRSPENKHLMFHEGKKASQIASGAGEEEELPSRIDI